MQLSYQDLCTVLGLPCTEAWKDTVVTRADYDSRMVEEGSLFVCIRGENTDGHAHAASAVRKGARILLCEHDVDGVDVPKCIVPDPVRALGKIAAYWRSRTSATVIGVTGTSGKTSVKQALASILSQVGRTAQSERNHNTQIGMPCSLLSTDGDERFWVFELGISHPEDMDELGSILQPDLALILNVGPGHTEGLGDLGVAHYKTRILLHLAPGGRGVVSADYPELVWKAMGTHVPDLTFFSGKAGVGGKGAYFGTFLSASETGYGRFRLMLDGEELEVTAPFSGSFGAENCTACATCASLLGVPACAIRKGLEQAPLPPMRNQNTRVGASLLVNDTYNANPLSMRRMLEAYGKRDGETERPFICVLGEMRELGKEAEKWHEELGRLLGSLRPFRIYWKGGCGDHVRSGLEQSGYTGSFRSFATDDELEALWTDEVSGQIPDGCVCLCKGSRGNHLETVIPRLTRLLE